MSSSARSRLDKLSHDLKLHSQQFLGYPIATDFDYTEIHPFFNHFLNNIGDPDMSSLCRLNTNDLEKEVLRFYAELFRGPKEDIWGYITSGSTEGNLYGLLAARERFSDGIVYHSQASHYSIAKNTQLLRMQREVITAQPNGEVDYDELCDRLVKNKTKPAIIVANIGTTMTEARDNIQTIQQVLADVGIEEYHIHCDAALVGMYARFITPTQAFDFTDGADSMAVSAYKFLGIPEPCGVVLMRRSLRVSAGENVSYIDSLDSTISGSRSGHTALMIWYRLEQLGRKGIKARYEQSIKVASYIQHSLDALGWPAWHNPGALTVVLKAPPRHLVQKWQLAIDDGWCHVMCMPGITTERIDRFIVNLREAADPSPQIDQSFIRVPQM